MSCCVIRWLASTYKPLTQLLFNRSLADAIGNIRSTILADLMSRDIEFAQTLGSYRPLAEAIVNDPRLPALLADQDGLLASAVSGRYVGKRMDSHLLVSVLLW